MTWTKEDQREKIRTQLKYELTHPTLWYRNASFYADKRSLGLCKGRMFESGIEDVIENVDPK